MLARQTLRKRHELRIPRPSIRPNVILCEPRLRINSPRLVKAHSPAPHDLLHLPFRCLVQPRAGITGRYIGLEIKVAGCKARLDVA